MKRETSLRQQGRAVVIMLECGGKLIRFKQKGRRTWHTATIEQCYWLAVANTAAEEKRARLLRRKERAAMKKNGFAS